MKNKQIPSVKSVSGENVYNVRRKTRKISVLNVLLIQVAVCLAVSVGVLAVRFISGNEVITAASVQGFLKFLTV